MCMMCMLLAVGIQKLDELSYVRTTVLHLCDLESTFTKISKSIPIIPHPHSHLTSSSFVSSLLLSIGVVIEVSVAVVAVAMGQGLTSNSIASVVHHDQLLKMTKVEVVHASRA